MSLVLLFCFLISCSPFSVMSFLEIFMSVGSGKTAFFLGQAHIIACLLGEANAS